MPSPIWLLFIIITSNSFVKFRFNLALMLVFWCLNLVFPHPCFPPHNLLCLVVLGMLLFIVLLLPLRSSFQHQLLGQDAPAPHRKSLYHSEEYTLLQCSPHTQAAYGRKEGAALHDGRHGGRSVRAWSPCVYCPRAEWWRLVLRSCGVWVRMTP